ncbi:hypothetical protein [Streptomyces sp. NBC_01506]|uniref:hypothetical protein n=1 Tax=Streptomyces sp. NBC_01506 TaxID=2903887 RepID=UPI00386A2D53
MPTEAEAATLRIGAGVPVLRYTRRHIADTGRVVEVAHPIVRRGDTTTEPPTHVSGSARCPVSSSIAGRACQAGRAVLVVPPCAAWWCRSR